DREDREADGERLGLQLQGDRRLGGPRGGRHSQALCRHRHVHLRSWLHVDRQLPERDHLYRWGERHSPPPRLSDRPAGRTL
ncbi:MAG: Citrate synthase (si), partial [uncultured Sphingomonas sp.]